MPSLEQQSKYLSYILRHKPESIGVTMDENGWVKIGELIMKSDPKMNLSIGVIVLIAHEDEKQRYSIRDGGFIRANQGHSIKVDLQLKKAVPKTNLYHATALNSYRTILKEGLKKMRRHHVHLSDNKDTALEVGRRRGAHALLIIDARKMVADGIEFFLSENKVWLTDYVDPKYIKLEV
jgi:putative RNA 2'-phosphotransferase